MMAERIKMEGHSNQSIRYESLRLRPLSAPPITR